MPPTWPTLVPRAPAQRAGTAQSFLVARELPAVCASFTHRMALFFKRKRIVQAHTALYLVT